MADWNPRVRSPVIFDEPMSLHSMDGKCRCGCYKLGFVNDWKRDKWIPSLMTISIMHCFIRPNGEGILRQKNGQQRISGKTTKRCRYWASFWDGIHGRVGICMIRPIAMWNISLNQQNSFLSYETKPMSRDGLAIAKISQKICH